MELFFNYKKFMRETNNFFINTRLNKYLSLNMLILKFLLEYIATLIMSGITLLYDTNLSPHGFNYSEFGCGNS